MSNERSPREVCSTTMGTRGDMRASVGCNLQPESCTHPTRPEPKEQPQGCDKRRRAMSAEVDDVRREVLLPLEPEEAWPVVSEPEHLEAWLGDDVELDLRPGGEVVVRWEGGAERRGTVESVEDRERLAFRWHAVTPGDPDDRVVTRVEIGLEAVPGGTRLTVVESGLSAVAAGALLAGA